jgi:hypothetical protein
MKQSAKMDAVLQLSCYHISFLPFTTLHATVAFIRCSAALLYMSTHQRARHKQKFFGTLCNPACSRHHVTSESKRWTFCWETMKHCALIHLDYLSLLLRLYYYSGKQIFSVSTSSSTIKLKTSRGTLLQRESLLLLTTTVCYIASYP